MNSCAVFVRGRKLISVAAVSVVSTIVAASMSSAAFAVEDSATETMASDVTMLLSSPDLERKTQMSAVEQYYLRDGIHLDKAQITAIVDNKPEIVDLAMSERNVVVQNLIGTGGGQLEVNGEAAIRQQIPVANGGSWAGLYVHTPEEDEALLGYRSESGSVVTGSSKSNKAIWGITKGGVVYGELGSTYHKDQGIGIPPPPAIDNAYGVFGVANDPDATRNYGVYGESNRSNGVGVYGKNTELGGRAGYFEGSVEQDAAYGGVVKAAAYVGCGLGSPDPLIKRKFQPAGAGVFRLTVASGGHCTLDFGFDILERYFQATAASNGAASHVACQFGSTPSELDCTRFLSDGSSLKGPIMVTIY